MMSKFKKKIALLVCMCLMAVSVAGCMRVESDCTINADGTVVVSATAGFEKTALIVLQAWEKVHQVMQICQR